MLTTSTRHDSIRSVHANLLGADCPEEVGHLRRRLSGPPARPATLTTWTTPTTGLDAYDRADCGRPTRVGPADTGATQTSGGSTIDTTTLTLHSVGVVTSAVPVPDRARGIPSRTDGRGAVMPASDLLDIRDRTVSEKGRWVALASASGPARVGCGWAEAPVESAPGDRPARSRVASRKGSFQHASLFPSRAGARVGTRRDNALTSAGVACSLPHEQRVDAVPPWSGLGVVNGSVRGLGRSC